jgi:hypothetical protein
VRCERRPERYRFNPSLCGRLRINVTELTLAISLDDKILQARETESTKLHVVFGSNSGAPLSGKTIQLKRKYKQADGKDTIDYILSTTDSQGKCAFTIVALPYDCEMMLEVTAFNTSIDIASATTTLSFLTTRTITVNAIPSVIQADGSSKSTITVQVKSELNNPIVGDQIKFTSDAGMVSGFATTDENGRAVGYLSSDRRNTVANVMATLVKDPTKSVRVMVEFTGVELTASANPPSINSGGKDTSTIDIILIDAAKNPIVGEPINFSKQQDNTRFIVIDSATNNRGEAHCKVYGTGSGIDTIKIGAAGASTKVALNYSSNSLVIDTVRGQPCIANGRDSTLIKIKYCEGDAVTPIKQADIDVSITLGSLNNDTVFTKRLRLNPADNGVLTFSMKNPDFANTATISAFAKTALEITTASFQLYFRASRIKRIKLSGSPEVIATNGSRAKIIAVAFDSIGNRVKDERISFNMPSGPGGGEHIDPATAITAEDGSAITYLVSGKTPSMFREVWVTAGDLFAQKSDTIKFTIAGPPHSITIRENLITGVDYKDGTFGLPCASIVTDVNGNPVADGTEVTFSLKVTGWLVHRPVVNFSTDTDHWYCYSLLDTMIDMLPFEDLNDNFQTDPGEDINNDGVASRGEDIDGDGKFTLGPPFEDINRNGKRDYLPGDIAEPWRHCDYRSYYDSLNLSDTVYRDLNGNGELDLHEPLIDWADTMSDDEYTRRLNIYKAAHHGKGYDVDNPQNGAADPKTAIVITRTVQTVGGKAPNIIIYGQSDAWKCEVTIWAESQGVRTESPAKFVLPVITTVSGK